MIESFKIPTATFPTLTGSIVTFNSQYAGLPLKSHEVAIDYTGSAISGVNIGSDNKYADFITFNQIYNYTSGSTTGLGVVRTISSGLISFSGESTSTGNSVTFAWTDFTVPNGHKVIVLKDFTLPEGDFIFDQYNGYGNVDITNTIMNISAGFLIPQLKVSGAGNDYTGISGHLSVIDLTVMFGSTIADEIYNMEQQTAGSGVAYFRSLFPNDYYDYNAGTLTTVSAVNGVSNSFIPITFDTPIYGGSYDCLTGIVTSNKDSGGGDVSPTYQQTATANCETNLGENNIWADTGDTTLQYPKFG